MLLSRKTCCTFVPQRWIFSILASIGLSIGFVYAGFLSITIIEMVEKIEKVEEDDNSCPSDNPTPGNKTFSIFDIEDDATITRHSWDEYTQGIILSSFSWSYMICRFVYVPLAERFGGKYTLGLGILAQAILTFITPFLLNWGGSVALIITRVLIGVANSGMVPAVSQMIARWTTPANRMMIGNVTYSGAVIGIFFGNIIPPMVIKYTGMGWPAVFYFVGILGLAWFPIWIIFVYDTPESHPFVTKEELQYFQRSSEMEKVMKKLPSAPWKHIFRCKEFWAFTIIYTGSNWAFFGMLSGLPRYMDHVVKFSLESNGYFSSLPYICMWLSSILSAWINDKILEKQWVSLNNMRKILATISTTGPGIFLLLASYAECDRTMVVIMFMLGITLFGNFIPSAMMNPLDLSPNYAASIMGIGEGIASSIGILAPYTIGVIAPNSTLGEWRIVFWIIFFFSISSNAVYLWWFKAEVQPWDDPNFDRSETKSRNVKEVELDVVT